MTRDAFAGDRKAGKRQNRNDATNIACAQEHVAEKRQHERDDEERHGLGRGNRVRMNRS